MLHWLWLLPTLPLLSYAILGMAGRRMPKPLIGTLGAGSVGLSAVIALLIAARFISEPPQNHAFTQVLWVWMDVGGFQPGITLYLDPLSLVMVLVVTCVGFLIHLYSVAFMAEDPGYSRFFAYMNLFVGAMLLLVLADNLVLLYLGWEGVGLCSFLLIGFWYQEPANTRAARKAFIVTRVGDTAMAIGLFFLFAQLGSLEIQPLMTEAQRVWEPGSAMPTIAALLLLGGALGKSAQLPLQTWLPDAMAGPSPVSALIHAATMVTAGVYLIARTHLLFMLAPAIMLLVAFIGAITLLGAGCSALTQRDIKRVLAYSTISHIGYMFVALGVGAWAAGIFHLVIHAFFKALLFLAAGVVIHSLDDEHDIYRMGGLRKELPVTFITFVAGGLALAGVPLVTAGFYSKDLILWEAWSSGGAGYLLWFLGLLGSFLSALYIFRVIFVAFYGQATSTVSRRPGMMIQGPLAVLAVLSIVAGWIELPRTLGGMHLFSEFIHPAFSAAAEGHQGSFFAEIALQIIAGLTALGGIYLAYKAYLVNKPAESAASDAPCIPPALYSYWARGWGFDGLYDAVFVRPYCALANFLGPDPVDGVYRLMAKTARGGNAAVRGTQTGRLRWYAACIVVGMAMLVTIVLFS